jgi:hypothetical protein
VLVLEGLGPEGRHRVRLGRVEDDLRAEGGHKDMIARGG